MQHVLQNLTADQRAAKAERESTAQAVRAAIESGASPAVPAAAQPAAVKQRRKRKTAGESAGAASIQAAAQ